MRNVLIIMHAREIPICMAALNELRIDKAWFTGYTELELEEVMSEWIRDHAYENYILVSDDTTPTQKALDCVEQNLRRGEVFTGWCNISPGSGLSTISHKRLSIPGDHEWEPIDTVLKETQPFTTSFACFALTAAEKGIWEHVPFSTYVARQADGHFVRSGWGSDFMFSVRLQEMGIPIYSHRDAYVHHLASRENMIVGTVKPEIIFERWQAGG